VLLVEGVVVLLLGLVLPLLLLLSVACSSF